ncbi:MAG: hypothetical protein F4X16_01435 [Caldilineaceae bacterium SB0661_bin_34]|nr:hypothetical protein [Caldilineaceae bacterium SB0661_bin_34]
MTPTTAGSKHPRRSTLVALVVTVLLVTLALSGCVVSEHTHGEHGAEGAGHEHAGVVEGSGEESGNLLTLEETYDVVRLGARLILAYSAEDNAFVGTVQNTTDETLPQVRVEVHLSNGVELGPTTPQDLEAGQTVDVVLSAVEQEFDGWSPHAEVGGSEHGHEGEG